MNEVRFQAVLGDDRVIRLPEGVDLPRGVIEVTVRPGEPAEAGPDLDIDPLAPTRAWMLALAAEAENSLAGCDLPADLAKHHDHYAHGTSRP